MDSPYGPKSHHAFMGTFDIHSDILELPELQGQEGLIAHELWYRCGQWTAAHGRTGVVPHSIARDLFGGDDATIERLIRAGLWETTNDGYRMLRGPSSDPDQPLPLWRYSDDDLGGRLFARDDAPNT